MKAKYICIELVFLALVYTASLRIDVLFQMPVAQLGVAIFLGIFATLRTARTISYNAVMAWLRDPFTVVEPDSSGAGDSINAKSGSAVGELLSCPICSGVWSALILTNIFLYLPAIGWILLIVLGLSGASEVLHWQAEKNEWAGRAAREEAGTQWLWKHEDNSLSALERDQLIFGSWEKKNDNNAVQAGSDRVYAGSERANGRSRIGRPSPSKAAR